jgi:hypothetical protein
LKRFARQNSLTLFFLVIFLITVAAQSQAGWRLYRDDQHTHHQPAVSYPRYLVSPRFSAEVMENWQSEFLQFTLYILATIWLVQKGSNESKQEDEAGREDDQKQLIGRYASADSPRWARLGGWRTTVYSNSLVIAMTTIFLPVVVRALPQRVAKLQRRPARPPPADGRRDDLLPRTRILGHDAPELAIRIPGRSRRLGVGQHSGGQSSLSPRAASAESNASNTSGSHRGTQRSGVEAAAGSHIRMRRQIGGPEIPRGMRTALPATGEAGRAARSEWADPAGGAALVVRESHAPCPHTPRGQGDISVGSPSLRSTRPVTSLTYRSPRSLVGRVRLVGREAQLV